MSSRIHFDVNLDGPFFEGWWVEKVIDSYAYHWENIMGDLGVAWIRAYLPAQYKYLRGEGPVPDNAGYYQSVIHKVETEDSVLIHDTPCVYGPWLEGVGSRNYPVTRFRGYHTFRVISQQLREVAVDIALAELPRYVEDLNG